MLKIKYTTGVSGVMYINIVFINTPATGKTIVRSFLFPFPIHGMHNEFVLTRARIRIEIAFNSVVGVRTKEYTCTAIMLLFCYCIIIV